MRRSAEHWTRFSVRVPATVADPLGTRCIELGAPGVVVEERNLRRDATTDGGVRPARPDVAARFTAYFPPDLDPHRLEVALRACLDALDREFPAARKRTFRLEPYRLPIARSARGHFPPVRIGKRLLVAPSWTTPRALKAAAGSRIVLQVDPAQAFGTGHHPTTRGCLVALERVCGVAPAPRRGLDVGSGTGILAVAMRALGVAAVTAVDTDPVARTATLACAAANGFADVRVLASLARARGTYDVVTANLFAGLLAEMAPQLAARVRAGGHLIVAGLLASQEVAVLRALRQAGFRLVRRECRATWSTLTLVRSHPARRSTPAARAAGRR